MNITLYGASRENIDQTYKDAVEALGAEMAKRGHTMVFGGGSTGLMGAAARGITKNGVVQWENVSSPAEMHLHFR